jgi:hypothetical protein
MTVLVIPDDLTRVIDANCDGSIRVGQGIGAPHWSLIGQRIIESSVGGSVRVVEEAVLYAVACPAGGLHLTVRDSIG